MPIYFKSEVFQLDFEMSMILTGHVNKKKIMFVKKN